MRFISIFTHEPVNRAPTEAEMAAMGKLIEDAMKEGWLLSTEGVSFGNTGVRVHRSAGGKITVTDGPFTEAKEVIGGYWFIVAGSLEEAAKIAAGNPCLSCGLFYEIRPIDPERASALTVTTETPSVHRD